MHRKRRANKRETIQDELNELLLKFRQSYPEGVKQLLKKYPISEVWRLFLDGRDQQNGETWEHYEKREPGFLCGMSTAFAYILDRVNSGTPFNLDFIKTIHSLALGPVKKTNYDSRFISAKNKHEFDNNRRYGFDLTLKNNATEKGIEDILNRMKKGNPFINLLHQNPDNHIAKPLNIFVEIFYRLKRGGAFSKKTNRIYLTNSHTFNKNSDTSELAKQISGTIFRSFSSNNCFFASSYQKTADDYFNLLIEKFNYSMVRAKTPHKKLRTIVKFISECEQSHPYLDGNGRTFCTLLLNYLLIVNNFPPVILYNPNRFDGFDIDSLVNDVIAGMLNTLNLIETKKLIFCNPTNDILNDGKTDTKAFYQSCTILKKYFSSEPLEEKHTSNIHVISQPIR